MLSLPDGIEPISPDDLLPMALSPLPSGKGPKSLEIIATSDPSYDAGKIFNDYSSYQSLEELSYNGGIIDEDTLAGLLKCINNSPLKKIDLNHTFFTSPTSLQRLFQTLQNKNSLVDLSLGDCQLDDRVKTAFIALVPNLPNLRYLDISGHRFSIDSAFWAAIQNTPNLTMIQGVPPLPSEINEHFANNKLFQQLESYLQEWDEDKPTGKAAKAILTVRKRLFYDIVKKLQQKQNSDKNRLNNLLSRFFLQFAEDSHNLGDTNMACEYYERALEHLDEPLCSKTHHTLGALYYFLAKEDVTLLLKAYQHLTAALEHCPIENRVEVQTLQSYCGISLGDEVYRRSERYFESREGRNVGETKESKENKELVSKADDLSPRKSSKYPFKRNYSAKR